MCELKAKNNKILSVCCGGIVNQAIIVNITALMSVIFIKLYQFSYIQMAMLTAIGFLAQLSADILLLAIIDKIDKRKMAKLACICSGIGFLFYGSIPLLFHGVGIYIGIIFATIVFAFSGGFLEIILSSIADSVPTTFGGVCLLHTVYAWSFAALSMLFLVYFCFISFINWCYLLFLLAIVPFIIFFLIDFIPEYIALPQIATLPKQQATVKQVDNVDSAAGTETINNVDNTTTQKGIKKLQNRYVMLFYVLAFLAVFFGYGSEIIVSQWVSIFASTLLQNELLSMLGPIFFAICLGLGGMFYIVILQKKQKIPFILFIVACIFASILFLLSATISTVWLALVCLILSGLFVGILSPSAITYTSKSGLFLGGWMFALLAISQDVSATILPAIFGVVATHSMRHALLVSVPLPLLAGLALLLLHNKKQLKKR